MKFRHFNATWNNFHQLRVMAASGVHPQRGAVDEGRARRQEEADRGGDLLRGAQPLGRDLGPRHLEDVDGVVVGRRLREDDPGRHRVHPHTVL